MHTRGSIEAADSRDSSNTTDSTSSADSLESKKSSDSLGSAGSSHSTDSRNSTKSTGSKGSTDSRDSKDSTGSTDPADNRSPDFQVKELKPELADTFLEFMSGLDFGHEPHWDHCYCRYHHSDLPWEEWKERSSEENREEARKEIAAGRMKGYLVFAVEKSGSKCVGWCNANNAGEFARLKQETGAEIDSGQKFGSQKIGCIICFTIHPDYRRQGLSKLLLQEAVAGFRSEGYDAVLALPVNYDNPEMRYRGTVSMFREAGFKEIKKDGNMTVMRLGFC